MDGKFADVDTPHRLSSIDWLRSLAIIGVLILHSGFDNRFDDSTLLIWKCASHWFDWSVLAFFFASGVLHNLNTSLPVLFLKRFRSLLIPFIFYHFLYTLFFFLLRKYTVFASRPGPESLLSDLASIWPSTAFQLYFLPVLFTIILTSTLISNLARSYTNCSFSLCIIASLTFYTLFGFPISSHGSGIQNWPLYFSMFLIGILCRKLRHSRRINWRSASLFIFASIGILILTKGGAWTLFVPPLLWHGAEFKSNWYPKKLAGIVGQNSGSIYLWHTPLLLPAVTIAFSTLGFSSLTNWISSVSFTLVFCLALKLVLNHLCIRILRVPFPRILTL
jgi:peptidoglycan/LPS O-acetylase OafA/YrhL